MYIPQTGKKNQKNFSVLKIIAFVSGTSNSHHPQQDTCHSQSLCYETTLKFKISLREIFCKSDSLRVMKKYDESAVMQILREFDTL